MLKSLIESNCATIGYVGVPHGNGVRYQDPTHLTLRMKGEDLQTENSEANQELQRLAERYGSKVRLMTLVVDFDFVPEQIVVPSRFNHVVIYFGMSVGPFGSNVVSSVEVTVNLNASFVTFVGCNPSPNSTLLNTSQVDWWNPTLQKYQRRRTDGEVVDLSNDTVMNSFDRLMSDWHLWK